MRVGIGPSAEVIRLAQTAASSGRSLHAPETRWSSATLAAKEIGGAPRDAGQNARAGTPAEAAHDVDAPLLAAYWSRIDKVADDLFARSWLFVRSQ